MHLDIKREVSQWLTSRSFYTPRAALARGAELSESKEMQPLSVGQSKTQSGGGKSGGGRRSKTRSGSEQSPRVGQSKARKGKGQGMEKGKEKRGRE